MKKFIAYFDYLGFRQFIEKNDVIAQKKGMSHIFREIEHAIAKGKTKDARHGIIADLEESNLNCINFSDTVIFWTEDDSLESLKEILEVSYIFNWRTNGYFFPARGAVVHGELEAVDFSYLNGKVQNPVKLTPASRSKLTPSGRSKLTPGRRSKLTPLGEYFLGME